MLGISAVGSTQWADLLRSTKVQDLLGKKNRVFITLKPDSTVRDAMETLAKNNILSAPVLQKDRVLLGFVDVIDLAAAALHVWKKSNPPTSHPNDSAHLDKQDAQNLQQQLQDLHKSQRSHDLVRSREIEKSSHSQYQQAGGPEDPYTEFFSRPVTEIMNFSRLDPPVVVELGTSLAHVIDAIGSKGFRSFTPHRAAVLDEYGLICNTISQWDVVAFAAQHVEELEKITVSMRTFHDSQYISSKKSIKDLRLGHTWPNEVVSVLDTTPLSDALETLHARRVSGVAVVDASNKLVANFSASDLRGMMKPETFHRFSEPVMQYLKSKGLREPVTIADTLPLGALVHKFADEHLHRVFITDDAGGLTGLVTLSDVLSLMQ